MHSVKWIVRILLAFVCFVAPVRAAPREFVDLINSLPAREQLLMDITLLQEKRSTDEQKRVATDELNKAKDGFVRLRPFLRTGTSVFEYPGLLALARSTYNTVENTYTLALGIPNYWGFDHEQGENPYAYAVIFDHQGLILRVNSQVIRH